MEKFECRDCLHVGTLDVHGACECCGSQSVISIEKLSVTCPIRTNSTVPATTSTSRLPA